MKDLVRIVWLAVPLLGLVLASGCSSNGRVGVNGTVRYMGEPIGIGTITFLHRSAQGIKCGGRIAGGHSEIDPQFGPMPGLHRVEIHWAKPTGKKYRNEFNEEFDETREGLHEKYNKQSTLTATIKPGHNVIDFNLDQ
jgi:hypothetical protein